MKLTQLFRGVKATVTHDEMQYRYQPWVMAIDLEGLLKFDLFENVQDYIQQLKYGEVWDIRVTSNFQNIAVITLALDGRENVHCKYFSLIL